MPLRLVILALITINVTGCIVVPIPRPQTRVPASRKPLDQEASARIRIDESTREDVLLALGEPDLAWNSERVLGYGWTTTNLTLLWAAGAGYSGAAGAFDVPTNFFLLIAFDEAGRVRRFQTHKAPAGKSGGNFVAELRKAW